jgi:hypothetical protein
MEALERIAGANQHFSQRFIFCRPVDELLGKKDPKSADKLHIKVQDTAP